MPKSLTAAQIEQYREEGCVFPIHIMSKTEAAEFRERLEEFERRTGGPLKGDMRHKSHLLPAASWMLWTSSISCGQGDPSLHGDDRRLCCVR
jgi:hypothetical protein